MKHKTCGYRYGPGGDFVSEPDIRPHCSRGWIIAALLIPALLIVALLLYVVCRGAPSSVTATAAASSPFLITPSAAVVADTAELMTVTAYCPCRRCCGVFADGITASGKPVTTNGGKFCAADKSIPFGTMIEIPGYGTVPVLDRGGAIKGSAIDVFFPSHKAALQWGRRTLLVTMTSRRNTESAGLPLPADDKAAAPDSLHRRPAACLAPFATKEKGRP